jgi:hypothetical protein
MVTMGFIHFSEFYKGYLQTCNPLWSTVRLSILKPDNAPPSPSRGYPLFNTWDVMMNSVVLSPRNFHQYSVLSCRKHLYDYIISLVWVDKPSFDWSACTKPGGWAVIYNVYYVCYRYHLTSLWLVHFIGIFLMVVIVYFHIISWEKKPIIQSCLNPNSLLIPIYIFFSYRMAEATTSRYESNYIKIAMVVLRVSSRAVRVQFDKKFDPVCLQRTLTSEQGHLTELKNKKYITQPQWNLLFPITGRLLYLFCCFLEQVGYYICFA